jgi:DNA-binding transcriptional ArsR family regulator
VPAIDRDIQVKFRFSAEERQMLEQLAEASGVNPTDYVRTLLRRTYAKEFNVARPARETPATFAGLIRDLTAPQHLTAGNIAARMGLSLGAVLSALDIFKRLGLVDRIDGSGFNSTWEVVAPKRQRATSETVTQFAHDVGFRDFDDPLEEWTEEECAQRARRARPLAKRGSVR